MALVDSTWLTPAVVRTHAGLRPGDATDTGALLLAANAAAELVEELHPQGFDSSVPPVYSPAKHKHLLGAALLAFRWYSRRAAPLGVAGYAELGAAGILRHDPDVARLLELGPAGRFVFGAPTPTTTTTEV